MSDDGMYDGDNSNGFAGLRKQLKEEKKLRREAENRLLALEAAQTGRSIREALTSRGLDPQVAKFYPKDRPTTDDSVDEWVEENRAVFGFKKKPEVQLSDIPTDVQRGYNTFKELQAAEAYTEMDFQSKLDATESPEQVMQLLKDYSPPMS